MVLDIISCFRMSTEFEEEVDDEEPLECNYDKDVTYLYQAIEEKAFIAAIEFLESGRKEEVRLQCRTWVTRYEEHSNEIRWSQLPLHAALIFKAPIKVIELLLLNYRMAARCTDDQKMLPLHLAFRYGASDNVIHLLLKEFPEAMNATDHKDRPPLEFSKLGDGWKKGEIIEAFIENATAPYKAMVPPADFENLAKQLEVSTAKNTELGAANEALKEEVTKLTSELDSKTKDLVSDTEQIVPSSSFKSVKTITSVTAQPVVTKTVEKTTTQPKKKSLGSFFKRFGNKNKDTKKVATTTSAAVNKKQVLTPTVSEATKEADMETDAAIAPTEAPIVETVLTEQ